MQDRLLEKRRGSKGRNRALASPAGLAVRGGSRSSFLYSVLGVGLLVVWAIGPAGALHAEPAGETPLGLPWREAGLTERQAAACLLDRLAFGARPGDVETVLERGLERWVERQLRGRREPRLEHRLAGIEALRVPVREFPERYPGPGRVLSEAQREGIEPTGDARATERRLEVFARQRGYRPQRELFAGLRSQKLIRAVHAESQLHEVLADFWFNHFNVSLADGEARAYVLAFERDAIRPHALGSFRELLGAVARHPAMLLYLDNARSSAAPGGRTTLESRLGLRRRPAGAMPRSRRPSPETGVAAPRGLNENYARELLELHTLGAGGGFTQRDVVEVARAFTGWTVYPPPSVAVAHRERLERMLAAPHGFVAAEGFLFRADLHDAGRKQVLGVVLAAERGIEDGEEVLDLLAAHPATARHLARKLAARFVSDQPPPALIDRLVAVYLSTGGDLERVMRALLQSRAFWEAAARRDKIKSPLELAVSAVRAVGGELRRPRALAEWVARMGQPLYEYRAPTGYPDRAEAWVDAGRLVQRMRFGSALAGGGVEGVAQDLPALAGGLELASDREALAAYLPLLLPERDHGQTLRLLDAHLAVSAATGPTVSVPTSGPGGPASDGLARRPPESAAPGPGDRSLGDFDADEPAVVRAVGWILGSPEFQRK